MHRLYFRLEPRPPFRLDLTALALQRRPVNRTDVWNGESYSRVLVVNHEPTLVEISQAGNARSPILHAKATFERRGSITTANLKPLLLKLLGLQIDLSAFYRLARSDPRLHSLAQRHLGLKPPRFPSVFEALINGIACQQLSLHVGLTLLNRLSEKSGARFESETGSRFAFPSAEALATIPTRGFRALGYSTNKAVAIQSASREILARTLTPESFQNLGNEETIARLLKLRGVGRWTAQYVLLRGLGRVDLFPGDDIGARKALGRWLKIKGELDYARTQSMLAKWRPFAGLLYFHLLLDGLEERHLFQPSVSQHPLPRAA